MNAAPDTVRIVSIRHCRPDDVIPSAADLDSRLLSLMCRPSDDDRRTVRLAELRRRLDAILARPSDAWLSRDEVRAIAGRIAREEAA